MLLRGSMTVRGREIRFHRSAMASCCVTAVAVVKRQEDDHGLIPAMFFALTLQKYLTGDDNEATCRVVSVNVESSIVVEANRES